MIFSLYGHWSGTSRQIDQFLKKNKRDAHGYQIHSGKRKQDYQLSGNPTNKNNRMDDKRYRKPTHTNNNIPKDFLKQPKYKIAVIKKYCHRATTISKKTQVVKQVSGAERYKPEEVNEVIETM